MLEAAAEHHAIRTNRRHTTNTIRWLISLSMGVALGMLVLGAVVLIDAREDAWQQAELASNNLVTALRRDIARSIAVYDLSLKGAINALKLPGIDQVSPEIRHTAIFDWAAGADDLGSILVIDADGNVVADSTSLIPNKLNLADRDYFRIHQERPDTGLYVSHTFLSRLRNKDPSIAISRRMSSVDGRFEGVVMGAIRLAYFHKLFRTLNLGAHGSVILFRTDGGVVVRNPPSESDGPDQELSNTRLFRLFVAAPSGQVVDTAAIREDRHLYTFHRVGDLPLILAVVISVDEVYAAWWHKALVIGLILALLCGATVALCLLFRREILRRMSAEVSLMKVAKELEVIAATDDLTGLANRRSFDINLDKEWKRAIRGSTSLALLMLDADYFKLYNDQYGHQEGDQVLRIIALCIRQNIGRPSDLTARFGGEEFVAILPATDISGAIIIAERIRSAVIKHDIPHIGSPIQRVSVSIGIAISYPCFGEIENSLLKKADVALYDAKRLGRNCVSVAGRSSPLHTSQVITHPLATGGDL